MADGKDLNKDTWYINQNGDSIRISRFDYFISNIRFTKTDGNIYTEPESYHLIQEKNAPSKLFTIDIPEGSYSSMSFIIGVDSARNVSGAQTGALEPNSGMFWDWKTGYIMAKLEGESPQSTNFSSKFIYHIGGFAGTENALRTVKLSFNNSLLVGNDKTPTIHIKADAMEFFKTPNKISVKDTYTVMSTTDAAQKIANNYSDMFSIDHID